MATTTDTKADALQAIGKNAYESIRDMVAALECDYDRLEELRDERAAHGAAIAEATEEHESEQTEETADALAEAIDESNDWETDNAEELNELEEAAGDCESREDAEKRIQEDPLSIRIFGERTNGEWEADRFEILLSTGGPAVRIRGELDGNAEPDRAWLETQDWGTPWTQYFPADQDTLLTYSRCFHFGE